jgi:hypothetical protein
MSSVTDRVRYFESMALLCEREGAPVLMRAYQFWASCPEACVWGEELGAKPARLVVPYRVKAAEA